MPPIPFCITFDDLEPAAVDHLGAQGPELGCQQGQGKVLLGELMDGLPRRPGENQSLIQLLDVIGGQVVGPLVLPGTHVRRGPCGSGEHGAQLRVGSLGGCDRSCRRFRNKCQSTHPCIRASPPGGVPHPGSTDSQYKIHARKNICGASFPTKLTFENTAGLSSRMQPLLGGPLLLHMQGLLATARQSTFGIAGGSDTWYPRPGSWSHIVPLVHCCWE